jgi:hypothetical protein
MKWVCFLLAMGNVWLAYRGFTGELEPFVAGVTCLSVAVCLIGLGMRE